MEILRSVVSSTYQEILLQNEHLGKTKTMTMTKMPAQKTRNTYGHGPLIVAFEAGMNDDHHQYLLKRDLLHIWP